VENDVDGYSPPLPLQGGLHETLAAIEAKLRSVPALPEASSEEAVAFPDQDRSSELIGELLAEGDTPVTGFASRLFAQVSLPYRDPGTTVAGSWVRRNGLVTLTVRPGEWLDPKTGELRQGFPYGALPRLLLTWMTTEAVRTSSRQLYLGHSLYEFTGRIGLTPAPSFGQPRPRVGGRESRLLLDQMQRLFHAPITAYDARDPSRWHSKSFLVADEGMLLFDPARPDQAALWGSEVILSERFFESVRAAPVPVDLAALARLKGSPLRLDIYVWLTYRMHYLRKLTTVPWEALAAQFGGDYTRLRAFKAQFVKQLQAVRSVYPKVKIEPTKAGLVLRPSPTHVPRRQSLGPGSAGQ
jgi:Plasmid encoded RepA protein